MGGPGCRSCMRMFFGCGSAARNFRVDLNGRDRIFGLGEMTGPMDKRGLRRELWNIDVLGHAPAIYHSLKSLYVSIPFALLMREGRAFGIFWDNPSRQIWDMGHTN